MQMELAKKHPDLVYDVGMHQGEDTDYYLKRGFRVIAFEANPKLVAECRTKFADAISDRRLTIVEGAITDRPAGTNESTVPFYENASLSVWGTVVSDWARRNELLGTSSRVIEVPVSDFAQSLRQFGIPHYLKIDIEGMDTVCLAALAQFEQKPDYVSMESNKTSIAGLAEELNLLTQLGYTKFKIIQQATVPRQREPNPSKEGPVVGYQFKFGSSGLFGADLPREWQDYEVTLGQYKSIFFRYKLFGDYGILRRYFLGRVLRKVLSLLLRTPSFPGWYDTHAKHISVV
jgi:FkbM family methyltransferase